ncbi:MAG: YitT family protein, partial [Clostridia bacterium]|nr:YitT family protein [Clostridia bacterium]
IVKKYKDIQIGRALLLTDIAIVILGGLLSGFSLFLGSVSGLLVKTFGIDFVIAAIKKRLAGKGN